MMSMRFHAKISPPTPTGSMSPSRPGDPAPASRLVSRSVTNPRSSARSRRQAALRHFAEQKLPRDLPEQRCSAWTATLRLFRSDAK